MPASTSAKPTAKPAEKSSIGSTNPAVDAVIAKAPAFAQPILRQLRALVHEAAPDAVEEIKWSRPFFSVNSVLVCQMSAFTKHCGFGFWSPEMTALLTADGVRGQDASGSFGRISSMDDLPPREKLLGYIRHAADLARSGTAGSPVAGRARTSAKAPIPIPPEFAALLAKSKSATATFEAFPPSCKREYLEWITTAKRQETRERRMTEAVNRMAAGRRFNEEYQSK
ncbi:YdeI/OmpD-associated family protein [Terriglobus roseus]|uniref:Uncharacterized conserved protein YdeI, YjbR/CyaY-like superfamily, DUF1801 family n=1 Tax=Terriglobus roseus TaxID=392734 RepID=A0A1H4PTV5_9BACT|nr:YdeI/OmpD-associated family protein [Terriglobus roseus]SEC10799.1 Uncharacterized conserved protein YdeI, YjbR/CyaY-like superfamily, DUF1801 family [Terriglobus roseus]